MNLEKYLEVIRQLCPLIDAAIFPLKYNVVSIQCIGIARQLVSHLEPSNLLLLKPSGDPGH